MRKVLFILALMVCSIVHATEYRYMVFSTTSGANIVLSVTNLTAEVNGTQLEISNADGTTRLVLTDMRSMQFSEDGEVSALEDVINADQPIQVYSISGTLLGRYENLVQAAQRLSTGAYVISNGNNTQTIVVK